jgi:hypothetical protein
MLRRWTVGEITVAGGKLWLDISIIPTGVVGVRGLGISLIHDALFTHSDPH